MFVAVAGIIGAGKSTLCGPLAEAMGGDAYYEPVETNPYLDDFYKDMNRWGFTMQMYLLAQRFALHQRMVWADRPAILDRSIYEDVIFARVLRADGFIDDRDFANYEDHFKVMLRYLVYPDAMLYLKVPPKLALERVKLRARGCEVSVPLAYLKKLDVQYDILMAEMAKYTRVIRLDWRKPMPAQDVADIIRGSVGANPMPFARHKRP